jgi:Ca2+-binding EF-hand superfamily protein
VDSNHDGIITRDEFTAAMSRRFKEIDKNRNGLISLEEHAYFMSKNAGSAKKVK